jgi:hypothetical protein
MEKDSTIVFKDTGTVTSDIESTTNSTGTDMVNITEKDQQLMLKTQTQCHLTYNPQFILKA